MIMATAGVAIVLWLAQVPAPSPAQYRDAAAGLSFQIPSGWGIDAPAHQGERETTVQLHDPQRQGLAAFYYKRLPDSPDMSPEQIKAALRAGVDAKIAQRRREGILSYHLGRDRCEAKSIAAHAALVCTAEYVQKQKAMVEHLVWIRSQRLSVLLFARAPAPLANSFWQRLDRVLATLRF
jgi:hypothetical protein